MLNFIKSFFSANHDDIAHIDATTENDPVSQLEKDIVAAYREGRLVVWRYDPYRSGGGRIQLRADGKCIDLYTDIKEHYEKYDDFGSAPKYSYYITTLGAESITSYTGHAFTTIMKEHAKVNEQARTENYNRSKRVTIEKISSILSATTDV